MTMITLDEQSNLYEQIAEQITRLIEHQALRPGDRVPSVRKLSMQHRISVGTVLQAYHLLEDRKLIEARPQSGYYVRARPGRTPPEPAMSAPSQRPTRISLGELSMKMLRMTGQHDVVQLGAAIPS